MSTAEDFQSRVGELLKLGRPTIGFGLAELNDAIVSSLEDSTQHAKIVLVGPPAIAGKSKIGRFEVTVDEKPEERLAQMLATDQVAGIVRGTLDDLKTTQAYERLTGEKYTSGPALLEDPSKRQFFMTPLSNTRGWTKESRLSDARELARFVSAWNVEPTIAIYAAAREVRKDPQDSDPVTQMLNQTFVDADSIASELRGDGYRAENLNIEFDRGVSAGFNIHVLVNGMVGNQILRAFMVCGGKIVAATRLGLSRVWEDNSRTETDYRFHVRWTAALINMRKHPTA
jgi:predicted methyltransferase MtxX (methanogen marker protein 4)